MFLTEGGRMANALVAVAIGGTGAVTLAALVRSCRRIVVRDED